jgi:hypothetical protein
MTGQADLAQAILSVIVGGLAAILLRETVDWLRKPILQMDLDLTALKPFTQQLITPDREPEKVGVSKFVRMKVHNSGRKAASYCEAKIEPMDENGNSLFDPSILHWVRKYATVYPRPEEQFTPITINRGDHEFLDVLSVFKPSNSGNKIRAMTYSHRPYPLLPHERYRLRVTVFSENATPKKGTICFTWDGTWDGFNERCLRYCSD